MVNICDDPTLTDEEKWEALYGTSAFGNLPQYKVFGHVGHCYAPCPYSSQASDLRTRHLLKLSEVDPLPLKTAHVGSDDKEYFMRTAVRGSWGFECTYSGCAFLLSTGFPYFYR